MEAVGKEPGEDDPPTPKAMKVAVAVDASDGSLEALRWALDHVIDRLPTTRLLLLHAQHPVELFVCPVAGQAVYATTSVMDSVKKAQQENSRKVISRALEICKEKEVNATAAIVEGDAKEAICEAVERMEVDLLVVGSRGLGRIKRAFLGSVSDYVAHHACCPVLIVRLRGAAHHK